jgi:hypothetical protein
VEEGMRQSVWSLCIWGTISIFTETDIFPPVDDAENKQNSQLQQVIDLYVAQMDEAEEDL